MQQIITLLLLTLSTFSSGQYCINGGPTSANDSNIESVSLTGDIGSLSLTSNCPGQTGVQDLTTQSTTLSASSTYTLNVDFGTCGGNYQSVAEAWIDFNGDGVFDVSESIGSWNGTPPAPVVAMTFTVPSGLANGVSRLRIMQNENGSLPLDPCDSFTWGNVIDFGINLTGGFDCSAYLGDEMIDAIEISSLPFIDTNDNSFCYTNKNLVYNSPDIYYRILPIPNIGSITATLCGSSFDTFISAVKPDGTVVAFNDDDVSCGNQSTVTFTPASNDTIFLIVEGWGSASGEFILNVNSSLLNLEELSSNNFILSPNPALNKLQIMNFSGVASIYSLAGEKVLSKKYISNQFIDISNLVPGSYIVRLESGGNQFIKKMIVQ